MNKEFFIQWLKKELKKCYTKKGYRFNIQIIQDYKDGRRKLIRRKMILFKDRAGYSFSLDKVVWITLAKIQRIKTYESFTNQTTRIKIIDIK